MDIDERMEVNVAIQKLLEDPSNDDAAGIIIRLSKEIPLSSRFGTTGFVGQRQSKGSVVGHTQEAGEISVDTGEDEELRELRDKRIVERVGNYKLWRISDHGIWFQFYWKAEITTAGISQEPDEFFVSYVPSTLKYLGLFVEVKKTIFHLGMITVKKLGIKPLPDGKVKWGGWSIDLTHIE